MSLSQVRFIFASLKLWKNFCFKKIITYQIQLQYINLWLIEKDWKKLQNMTKHQTLARKINLTLPWPGTWPCQRSVRQRRRVLSSVEPRSRHFPWNDGGGTWTGECPQWLLGNCVQTTNAWWINEQPHDKTYKLACVPSEDSDQLDALKSCLSTVYTVCHSVCIFWTHYSMAKQHSSNLRIMTVFFSRCSNLFYF